MRRIIDRYIAWAQLPVAWYAFWDPRTGVVGGLTLATLIWVPIFVLT